MKTYHDQSESESSQNDGPQKPSDLIIEKLKKRKLDCESADSNVATVLNRPEINIEELENALVGVDTLISDSNDAIAEARKLLNPRIGSARRISPLVKSRIRLHIDNLKHALRQLKSSSTGGKKTFTRLRREQKAERRLEEIKQRSRNESYIKQNEGHIKQSLTKIVDSGKYSTKSKIISLKVEVLNDNTELSPDAITRMDNLLRAEAPEVYYKCTGVSDMKRVFYSHFAKAIVEADHDETDSSETDTESQS